MAHPAKNERIVFRKQDRIGANDADEDALLLAECFVDTGDLQVLSDCQRPERIVLGRTGCGKTALLRRLQDSEERAIEIKPASLALAYISNSTILQFFEALGVNLDPFYKLIWRHAFCVELLRKRFGLQDQDRVSLGDKIKAFFKGPKYSSAMKYLEQWGDKFWEETEYRVREITQRVEQSLKGSLSSDILPASVSAEGVSTLSKEQRVEVVHRAQKIINDAHAPQLNQIIDLVRDVLDDPQKPYFIVIDRLDESWVEEQLRYKLIMALIDTVKEFKRVPNAKIILALRIDLLQRVFDRARSAGFQEEKIESLYLRLRWSRQDLSSLIDARVNHVFRDRYAKNKTLSCSDLLAESRRDTNALEYILDRTFMRPRDAICFFNECIAAAEGHAKIALRDIRSAEGSYSTGRLQSVADEWRVEFPNLHPFARTLLAGVPAQGQLSTLVSEEALQVRCLALHGQELAEDGLSKMCLQVVSSERPCRDMMAVACAVFYRVGIVGVKLAASESFCWQSDAGKGLTASAFTPDTGIKIHPMFWRALGVGAHAT